MTRIEIDNKNSINGSKWKDPGADLFNKLVSAINNEELVKEAYLITPKVIAPNFPRSVPTYSGSGCKYPHHQVRDGKLLVNKAGLVAAYSRARQQGVCRGDVKKHLIKHYKELGMYDDSKISMDERMEQNFDDIDNYIMENIPAYREAVEELMSIDDEMAESYVYDEMAESYVYDESALNIETQIVSGISVPEEMYTSLWTEKVYLMELPDIEKYLSNELIDLENELLFKESYGDEFYIYRYRGFHEPPELEQKLESLYGILCEKGGLKYTYRTGFDVSTGTQIAVEFYLDPSRIIGVGDRSLTGKTKNTDPNNDQGNMIKSIHDKALEPTPRSIRIHGHLDHITSGLKVHSIFDINHRPYQSVTMIPAFSNPAREILKTMISMESINGNDIRTSQQIQDLIKSDKFKSGFLMRIKHHSSYFEEYHISRNDNDLQGEGKHKSTKLFWNYDNFATFALTPRFRGPITVNTRNKDFDNDQQKLMDEYDITNKPRKGSLGEDIELVNEMMDGLESFFEEGNIKDKNTNYIPVYGISKGQSPDMTRRDGSLKGEDELDAVRFSKVIKTLTRGDNYSHSLVSLDDSFQKMYSYDDEGFVVDNILKVDSWIGTKSIYVTVMFVSPEDYQNMKDRISYLMKHRKETKYASANLLKMFIGNPGKSDKRFVCSTLVGYLMGTGNVKNLHRDYTRIRPEDITIIPRAFYVMNFLDRDDFMARHDEFRSRVKHIYQEHKDEINDYNNHLPKLVLKEKMKNLGRLDKILDWVIDRM